MYTLLKLLVFSDLVFIFQILLCQEFGSAFTKRYLKELLDEPVEVKAKYLTRNQKTILVLKMAKHKENAHMTFGWHEAVRKYNIRKGEITLFCFTPKKKGQLDLLIVGLPVNEQQTSGDEQQASGDEQQTSEDEQQTSEDE
jgi:hypothetical protein